MSMLTDPDLKSNRMLNLGNGCNFQWYFTGPRAFSAIRPIFPRIIRVGLQLCIIRVCCRGDARVMTAAASPGPAFGTRPRRRETFQSHWNCDGDSYIAALLSCCFLQCQT